MSRIIDPTTGKPYDDGRSLGGERGVPLPMQGGKKPAPDPLPDQPYVLGVAVYDSDGTFARYVPADDEGKLAEDIVVTEGQVLVMVTPIAKAVPNPGTTVARIKAG